MVLFVPQMAKLESARKDKSKKLEHDDAIHAALLKHKEDLEREVRWAATGQRDSDAWVA